ncbi:MAG: hypothetical protein R3D59_16145 [Paracoccaceae bacterium]
MQKIRILNAGHQIFANIAEIMDIPVVSDIMQHTTIRAFLRKVEIDGSCHWLSRSGKTPLQYFRAIEERFANPAIVDTARHRLRRRVAPPGMVIPTIREAVAAGTVEGLALVERPGAGNVTGPRKRRGDRAQRSGLGRSRRSGETGEKDDRKPGWRCASTTATSPTSRSSQMRCQMARDDLGGRHRSGDESLSLGSATGLNDTCRRVTAAAAGRPRRGVGERQGRGRCAQG